jgi:PKD repeat protein
LQDCFLSQVLKEYRKYKHHSMKIDLKNKYHVTLILVISVTCFMVTMVLLSPYTKGPQGADADKDTIPDTTDNCPTVPNSDQADADTDGIGDVCDQCTDTDKDGYGDPGNPQNSCPDDNCPDVPNANQTDTDKDGIGDACDTCPKDPLNDEDNDGICGSVDNCPSQYNPRQNDTDGDGVGDTCELPPIADFTIAPSDPIQGETIRFTDITTLGGGGLMSWRWNFGDNTTSSEQHPTHLYPTIGTYQVQLNVTDINRKTSTKTIILTVLHNDPPTPPQITGPGMGRVDDDISLSITSTDPDRNLLSYEIEWGDQTRSETLGPFTSGTKVTVTHQWRDAGRYTIQVTCIDTHHTQSNKTPHTIRIYDIYILNEYFMEYYSQNHQVILFKLLYD